jgi:two-component system LytT family response regulator
MNHCDSILAAIVDDEPLARVNLRHGLSAFARWTVAGEWESAEQARLALESVRVQVVFLDIQMPRESGLGLARTLSLLDEPPVVIFVTAFERFAVEAFELHALDYLLKPFDDERLRQAVLHAEGMIDLRARAGYRTALRGYVADLTQPGEQPPAFLRRLSVRSVGRIESVAVDHIRWIAAAGNYVELHLADRVVLHRVTLSHLEQRLDPAMFLRVHRSTIVRRDQCVAVTVQGDGTYALTLKAGATLPVSERYIEAVRTLLTRSE